MSEDTDGKGGFQLHEHPRRMVENVMVTPFFSRHRKHKPMILKLHADILEEDDYVVLRAMIDGLAGRENLVDVSATNGTIDVSLHSGKASTSVKDRELTHSEDVSLHSSYLTPTRIDPKKLTVSHEGDELIVRVPKRR